LRARTELGLAPLLDQSQRHGAVRKKQKKKKKKKKNSKKQQQN
jgi:hypothetical protein